MAIDTSKLEVQIPEIMQRTGVPGLSMAVIENATLVWNKGFGVKDVRTGEPVDEQTIFAAASLSKPPFAYSVLRLCEQGILQLDTPLIEYVPDPYAASDVSKDSLYLEQITARHVLSHTSGMGNWSTTNQGRISFKPGERFQYSGEGFNYLQRAVEILVGVPLDKHMVTTMFEPWNMKFSSYVWKPELEPYDAEGHGVSSTGGHGFAKPYAAFTLITTTYDYAQFMLQMLQSNNTLSLKPDSVQEMLRSQVTVNDHIAWGLGWGLTSGSDGTVFWHWGDIGNFQCVAMGSRDSRTGVLIMTNSEHGLPVCADLIRATFGEEYEKPIRTIINENW